MANRCEIGSANATLDLLPKECDQTVAHLSKEYLPINMLPETSSMRLKSVWCTIFEQKTARGWYNQPTETCNPSWSTWPLHKRQSSGDESQDGSGERFLLESVASQQTSEPKVVSGQIESV